MKISKLVTITAALLLSVGAVRSQEAVQEVHVWSNPQTWWGNHFAYTTSTLYTANELSFDGFGSYIAGERKFSHLFQTSIRGDRGVFGGGVGLNYFFTRELGIGGDINMPADGGNLVDSMSGNLIIRIPIDPTGLAPYVFGGGGRGTEPQWQWFEQAGVGLEYRFNPLTGIFLDARYMFNNHTADELMLRSGLRFVF